MTKNITTRSIIDFDFESPEAREILREVVKEVFEMFEELKANAANDNHRDFPEDGRNGALGRQPMTRRDQMLARFTPEQIEASIGWTKFDEYAGRVDLSTRDAADFLGVSDWTLKSWRRAGNEGRGPRYTQLVKGGPAVYQIEDLIAFAEARRI